MSCSTPRRRALRLALVAAASSALLAPRAAALRLDFPLVVVRMTSSAACSAFQEQTTMQLYDAAAATAACAPYAVTSTSFTYISAPCSASACVAVAEELAAQLPDCEINGANEKSQLQDALAACGSTSASSSSSSATTAYTDIPVATRSPSASSSSSSSVSVGDECTDAQLTNMTNLYMEAAATSACSDYMSTTSIEIYAPCTATTCIAVIEDMAAAMPNCSYEGVNLKQELEDAFGSCGASGSSTSYTDIPVVTKSASSSSDSGECSNSELEELMYLYTLAAGTDACAAYSTVTSTYVDIEPPCYATACLSELVGVASQMPNCSYEGVNYKSSLTQGIEDCGVSLNGSSTGSASDASSSVNGLTNSTSASRVNAANGPTATAWTLVINVGAVLALALAL